MLLLTLKPLLLLCLYFPIRVNLINLSTMEIRIDSGVDKRRTDKKRTADGGPRTADRGRRTADGGPRTADRGMRTTDGGRRTADCGRRTTDGGPRTGDRGRRTADHGRRTTDGGRRTSDGGAFYIHMITTATNYNTLN